MEEETGKRAILQYADSLHQSGSNTLCQGAVPVNILYMENVLILTKPKQLS